MTTWENMKISLLLSAVGRSVGIEPRSAATEPNKINGFVHKSYGTAVKRILLWPVSAMVLLAQFCIAADLDIWTQTSLGPNAYPSAICYGNGKFVALGVGFGYSTNGALCWVSSDGANWSQYTLGNVAACAGIVYANNQFVAVGYNEVTGDAYHPTYNSVVLVSGDGIHWNQSNLQTNSRIVRITYGNGKFVAASLNNYGGTPTPTIFFVSPDGLTWTQSPFQCPEYNIGSISFGNGMFVALAGDNSYVSIDGLNWSHSSSRQGGNMYGLCYGDGVFVSFGQTFSWGGGYMPIVFTSRDATNWTSFILNWLGPGYLQYVAFDSGQFIASGYGAEDWIISSPDGTNWTQRAAGVQITSAAFGNGIVVGLYGNNLVTSGYQAVQKPSITGQRRDVIVPPLPAFLDSFYASGTLPLNYQWKFNGQDIAGETNAILAFGMGGPVNAGNYTVIVSNAYGCATSAVARLSVWLWSTPPTIFVQPTNSAIQVGSNTICGIIARGEEPLSYQWRYNGADMVGRTFDSLALTNAQFSDAGFYSVVIGNAYGAVTSAVATLTIVSNVDISVTDKTPPASGPSTIPTDNLHFRTFSNSEFECNVALDRNKDTIVLTHGWTSSSGDWPELMANILKLTLGSSTPNIVAWDWTTEAANKLPNATTLTQGQGAALGRRIVAALGPNYTHRIHFIGHSLGTLVNAKAANHIHMNGFSSANTEMTLLDNAEVAWGVTGDSWQTLTSLLQNDSSPQQDWKRPLPDQCAWADNYITAVGMPHANAVNVILTNLTPDLSIIRNSLELFVTAGLEYIGFTDLFKTTLSAYHSYPCTWYNNSISQIISQNEPAYPMGFLRSWDGGGYYGRPGKGTYHIESTVCPPSYPSYSGYDPAFNLVAINAEQANTYLNGRPQNLISKPGVNMVSSSANILANNKDQVKVQLVNAPSVRSSSLITGPYEPAKTLFATLVQLITTSLVNNVTPITPTHTKDLQVTNVPAYVWIPVTVPTNALTMTFNFMLQGDGMQDFFQVALNTNDLMNVETMLIQTNVTMSSGMLDVSRYAGQEAELFFGIVGGTSTNVTMTVSDIAFYVIPQPTLQIQLAGTNVALSWSVSPVNYSLQSLDVGPLGTHWDTITNTPTIIDCQFCLTRNIAANARFYRLQSK
jgi:pimeloyl-ACP methyl ester carboxylesterase